MASLIPGFEYDIFISYRQKDNKYDGWVTEFVDNLKRELGATFKEEISVYFDINPHDGLLETHEVGDSLKEKLKCLVFIPIISRTYCDPRSFAWEHEFKAFVDQASNDQFGLKVKMANGNVVSRVLPVRIYDLDTADLKLCETVLGGVLRGVEFIYKEPGVNRPLRSNEEKPHENLNNTLYRNQINKVANGIKDIIMGLKPGGESSVDESLSSGTKPSGDTAFKRLITENKKLFSLAKYRSSKILPWGLTILMAALLVILALMKFLNPPGVRTVVGFQHYLPEGEYTGSESMGSSVAISPEGECIVFVTRRNDTSCLSLRMINEPDAQLVTGTEGGEAPFFSPDGKWIAFFADGNLKKISIQGGAPQKICEAKSVAGGCWGEDDNIIYADSYKACLMKVPAAGGSPSQLTTALKFKVGETEHSHYWPQLLPGGKKILFTIFRSSENMQVIAYSLETGERWDLIEPGCHAYYVNTGHLVYAWKGDLMAVPFDLNKMKVTGQPEVVLRGLFMNNNGLVHFSISDNGSLVYIPGKLNVPVRTFSLYDHKGVKESLGIQGTQSPQFSPDGKQILFAWDQAQLWIYGLERGTLRRFTEKQYSTYWGIWSPDGKQIVFNSNMHGGSAVTLFRQMADGTGTAERIIFSNYNQQPKCWANGDSLLIYTEGQNPATGVDIISFQIRGDTITKPLLNSRFNEIHPDLSHDGHWLAYVSDESGREEVFIRTFPDLANKIQISTDGGVEPLWAPDGTELYYRDISGDKLMAVSFKAGDNPQIGKPELLFQGKFIGCSGPWGRNYDISPDGKKFLLIEEGQITSSSKNFDVILNWSEKLKTNTQP